MSALEQFGAVILGAGLVFIVLLTAVVIFLLWGRRMGAAGGLILDDALPPKQEKPEVSIEPAELVGKRGVAVTYLRPAGTVLLDDQRVDVVSEATFIPEGAHVVVTAVDGKRVIVRQITEDADSTV